MCDLFLLKIEVTEDIEQTFSRLLYSDGALEPSDLVPSSLCGEAVQDQG